MRYSPTLSAAILKESYRSFKMIVKNEIADTADSKTCEELLDLAGRMYTVSVALVTGSKTCKDITDEDIRDEERFGVLTERIWDFVEFEIMDRLIDDFQMLHGEIAAYCEAKRNS